MLCLLAIPGYGVYYAFTHTIDTQKTLSFLAEHQMPVALGIVGWIALFYLSTRFYEKAKYDVRVDEFGLTSKNDYWHMSDKERKEADKKKQEQMDAVLSQATIRKATHPGAKNPDAAMNALYGMETEKQKIREIVARAKYDKKKGKGMFGSHYVFYGNPGTGKTTFARILTGYLYQNGIIKNNSLIEVDGNTLKASAPGEGQMKAEILVKSALGGVLFIDEAYSMATGGYGNEAVDSLIKLMEDRRGDFVLILAGYTQPMARLLASNPGFRSRIKDYLEFPDYTTDEAAHIFTGMAKQEQMSVSPEAIEKFKRRYNKEKVKDDFGNARTVRNILDEAISAYALRTDGKKGDGIIRAEDIGAEPAQTPWEH